MMRRRPHPLTWLLPVALLLTATTAGAQQVDRQEAVVYGLNAAVPDGFVGTFSPPSTSALYMLAGQTSMISLRKTMIYFWPITNEYKADWEALNQELPGTLEISKGGEVMQRVATTDYTIQYTPSKLTEASARLFVGAEAVRAQNDFLARQAAFQKATSDYYVAQQAWYAAMDQFQNNKDKPATATPPPAPQSPTPIGIFSNGLNRGFPIKLDPGSYSLLVRDAQGRAVAGSQRSLTVFAPRRTAIGYTVVPETRWTTPEQVTDLADVILGKGGSHLYLEPLVIREYPQRAYAFLQNPQYLGNDTADWSWVHGEAVKGGTLEITGDKGNVSTQGMTSYQVTQSSGQGLGYQVQTWKPAPDGSASPDFDAYPLALGQQGASYTLRLIGPDGRPVPGSTRLLRVPAAVSFSTLLVLPVIPLVLGAIVMTRRRRRLRLPRNVAA